MPTSGNIFLALLSACRFPKPRASVQFYLDQFDGNAALNVIGALWTVSRSTLMHCSPGQRSLFVAYPGLCADSETVGNDGCCLDASPVELSLGHFGRPLSWLKLRLLRLLCLLLTSSLACGAALSYQDCYTTTGPWGWRWVRPDSQPGYPRPLVWCGCDVTSHNFLALPILLLRSCAEQTPVASVTLP